MTALDPSWRAYFASHKWRMWVLQKKSWFLQKLGPSFENKRYFSFFICFFHNGPSFVLEEARSLELLTPVYICTFTTELSSAYPLANRLRWNDHILDCFLAWPLLQHLYESDIWTLANDWCHLLCYVREICQSVNSVCQQNWFS